MAREATRNDNTRTKDLDVSAGPARLERSLSLSARVALLNSWYALQPRAQLPGGHPLPGVLLVHAEFGLDHEFETKLGLPWPESMLAGIKVSANMVSATTPRLADHRPPLFGAGRLAGLVLAPARAHVLCAARMDAFTFRPGKPGRTSSVTSAADVCVHADVSRLWSKHALEAARRLGYPQLEGWCKESGQPTLSEQELGLHCLHKASQMWPLAQRHAWFVRKYRESRGTMMWNEIVLNTEPLRGDFTAAAFAFFSTPAVARRWKKGQRTCQACPEMPGHENYTASKWTAARQREVAALHRRAAGEYWKRNRRPEDPEDLPAVCFDPLRNASWFTEGDCAGDGGLAAAEAAERAMGTARAAA